VIAPEYIRMNLRRRDAVTQLLGDEEVVDAPPCIRLARMAQIRPPRIRPREVGIERAERIDKARLEQLRELAALLVRKARVAAVAFGRGKMFG